MEFKKIVLDTMERCYSCTHIQVNGVQKILFASEAVGGSCYAYFGTNFEQKEVVWENAGGTMSIVEIPGTNGQFLATQKFFPGFQSQESKVVWGRYENGQWIIEDFMTIPYLHRFDLFASDGDIHFLACVLCGSKKDREDWSDPGKVLVGVLPKDLTKPMELKEILGGLVKNHGYYRASYQGICAGYVTSEKGVYVFTPPNGAQPQWQMAQLLDVPVSDVAVWDIDGDGEDEMATIEPFHGDSFKIYKKIGGKYEAVYCYPYPIQFAHAIWGGNLAGESTFICGVRRASEELFLIHYDAQTQKYKESIIEKGVGSANVAVLHEPHRDILISANHTKNEAALYIFKKD